MAARVQSEPDIAAIRRRLIDSAIKAVARDEVSKYYPSYGLYPTINPEEIEEAVLRLWSYHISNKSFTNFEKDWKDTGAHTPSVEARFTCYCRRLTELREIARNEGFAHKLGQEGDQFKIESDHHTLSSEPSTLAPELEYYLGRFKGHHLTYCIDH
jgi:hypothetical protein